MEYFHWTYIFGRVAFEVFLDSQKACIFYKLSEMAFPNFCHYGEMSKLITVSILQLTASFADDMTRL